MGRLSTRRIHPLLIDLTIGQGVGAGIRIVWNGWKWIKRKIW